MPRRGPRVYADRGLGRVSTPPPSRSRILATVAVGARDREDVLPFPGHFMGGGYDLAGIWHGSHGSHDLFPVAQSGGSGPHARVAERAAGAAWPGGSGIMPQVNVIEAQGNTLQTQSSRSGAVSNARFREGATGLFYLSAVLQQQGSTVFFASVQ